jgi:predicted metal-dependent enzyme (double-stranded beta helix superfamily)
MDYTNRNALDTCESAPYRDGMFALDRFVADCRAALATSAPAAAVGALVDRALAAPEGVEAALGSPRRGGLFTLHHSPELTILNVVWAPGMAIYPHEHRMWAVIGLYGGREDNTFYRHDARGLAVAGGKRLERSETALLDEAIIHSVVNPLQGFTGAIHVYGGDFFGMPRSEWAPDTLEERPFDVERARRAYAQANERSSMGKA